MSMTNEQIQALKGNKVSDPYYLVECCTCGEIYPSNKFSGGGQIADTGDYADYSCPHCGETENFEDFGSYAEKAWNYQQKQIDALLAERDADKALIAEQGREIERLNSLKTVSAARREGESEFHRGWSCGSQHEKQKTRALTVKLPEVRITAAESRRRNMTWRELGAYNEGADVAVEKISEVCAVAGITLVVGASHE